MELEEILGTILSGPMLAAACCLRRGLPAQAG